VVWEVELVRVAFEQYGSNQLVMTSSKGTESNIFAVFSNGASTAISGHKHDVVAPVPFLAFHRPLEPE